MQTQTTATAPKRGFNLQLFNFKKSIDKALTIRPSVHWFSMQETAVMRSDHHTWATVTFAIHSGQIWACCDCPAAERALPCYHVAAAAISNGIIAVPAGAALAVRDDVATAQTYDACARYDRARDDQDKRLHLEIVDDEPADRFRPAQSGKFTDDDGARVSWSVDFVALAAEEAYYLRKYGTDQL